MVESSGMVVHLKQPFNATRITASQIETRVKELQKENGAASDHKDADKVIACASPSTVLLPVCVWLGWLRSTVLIFGQQDRYNQSDRATDYRYESITGPLSCSRALTHNLLLELAKNRKFEFRYSSEVVNYLILISNFFLTASQNDIQ